MAEVRIEQSGAIATVAVDGVTLKGVTRLAVEMVPNSLPLVTLDLAAFKNDLELSDAALKIGGIQAPEALELAMLDYLSKKYPPKGGHSAAADA